MMYGWWGGFGWIFMIAFLALFVWLIVTAVRPRDDVRTTSDAKERALRILAERFARGEIDETEYNARKDELER